MKQLAAGFIGMLLGLMLAVPAFAADYDVVILNGRVMDPETKYDAVANVGVKDGKIAVITKDKIVGKVTIDAKGLVVAPGFIDGHQHGIEPYVYRMMVRDGHGFYDLVADPDKNFVVIMKDGKIYKNTVK